MTKLSAWCARLRLALGDLGQGQQGFCSQHSHAQEDVRPPPHQFDEEKRGPPNSTSISIRKTRLEMPDKLKAMVRN